MGRLFFNRAIYALVWRSMKRSLISSGKNFKMQNFGGVLSNFALVIAPPFAPGGYLAPTLRVSPSPSTERGLRASEGGEVCPLPLFPQASSLKPHHSSVFNSSIPLGVLGVPEARPKAGLAVTSSHSSFCILHFAFCIIHYSLFIVPPHPATRAGCVSPALAGQASQ